MVMRRQLMDLPKNGVLPLRTKSDGARVTFREKCGQSLYSVRGWTCTFSNVHGSPHHLLCVHIRRTDFVGHFMPESKRDFIEPALHFIVKDLKVLPSYNSPVSTKFFQQKGVLRTSLLFVGDDRNFTKTIDLNGMVLLLLTSLAYAGSCCSKEI